ncbi:DUF5522 domain-containing protein [methanotrophic endosymbiont of Bathymodiolus puteoserpentis (Logatchev)]|jgi:hypothetical protein|uniref:DUF5522 domain-containing protein n=1 Tax=methanotrophic endosymbiont of Bathymodiolus puteoserpentis (Logatchev) TaxID=343235 RepID=UPI00157AB8D5|nr:DUF5522 domain-containing protein [methanotrophic endosymbiont of Bathymodiolus puteoserpentis (Logatchev)]
MHKKCSACGAAFSCGAAQDGESCWCLGFPAIMSVEFDQDCRCKTCLSKVMAEKIELTIQESPLENMLELASQYNNKNGLIEYIDYTIEYGEFVYSKWYHLKRGTCCGNSCRQCPY